MDKNTSGLMSLFDIDDNINNINKNIVEHILMKQFSKEIAKSIDEEILKEIKRITGILDDNNKVQTKRPKIYIPNK